MNTQETVTNEDDSQKEYDLVYLHSLSLPSFTDPKQLEEVVNLQPDDDDVFVVTYPKCGTTWMQFIVWEIINKGSPPPNPNQMMFGHFPFIECTGVGMLNDLPRPRLIKTHLPLHLLQNNGKAKYIYVARSPWDCCVSYYNHNQMTRDMVKMSFNRFLELFIHGKMGWGDYFDHVLSGYNHRNDPNVLFLTYEELKKDTKQAVLDVARFLGEEYYEDLKVNEEMLGNCLKYSDFTYLKSMGMYFRKEMKDPKQLIQAMSKLDLNNIDKENFDSVPFFRKGQIGDWRNYFTKEHVEKFNEYMAKKVKNTELENFWQPLPTVN